ncbi:hypothetical protein HK103_003656 [Boothiomyces macroporosus]|uniref:Uncharacterized protein n=1 Tax=Boothiomyces macroporosus TaxID=261099 RepID=A0AAD5ULW6_9FUNG|nr:hypothetical protein HK103_003656 [Boothiomyces macroporosus]
MEVYRMNKDVRKVVKRNIWVLELMFFFIETMYCIFYLVEIQINYSFPCDPDSCSKGMLPSWIVVNRTAIHYIWLISISTLRLGLTAINAMLTDNPLKFLAAPRTLLNICTALPFLILSRFEIGQYVRCFLFIHQLKLVLMMKNKWSPIKFSEFTERFIYLVGNIWTLLFFGVAAFNYSESEFPGEKRSTVGSSTSSNNKLSLMDTFYFICITITTVGYAPQTIPGQVVIILLIISGITIVPGLVTDMQESLKMQQSGAGSYNPGRNPFIVICGLFNDTTRTIRVVRSILTRDKTENTTVVLLSRENLHPITKYALKKSKYKNRVFHIQGSGLVVEDLNRAQLKKAKGAIILANLSTTNPRLEDEHNTLRAWAFSDYEQKIPLFVETLLPDTSIFQESINGGTICINEFQQTYLAYNCLYRGVNLIQKFRKHIDFTEPWQLQYADGLQNEIFVCKMNPVFVGKPFAEVTSYLLKEFQIILFALDVYIAEKQSHHVVLNPGLHYSLKEGDQLIFIAPQYSDVLAACELTEVEYLRSKVDKSEVPDIEPLSPDITVPRINSSKSFDEYAKDYPPEAHRAKVPLCLLLRQPPTSLDSVLLDNANCLENHVLLISCNFQVFRFICTLRSAHLTVSELKPILIMCPRPPNHKEFNRLRNFPKVFFIVGTGNRRSDLTKAGVLTADRIVLMNLSQRSIEEKYSDEDDPFGDTSAMSMIINHRMISNLILHLCTVNGLRKQIITDLTHESNVKFISYPGKDKASQLKNGSEKAQSDYENDQLLDFEASSLCYISVPGDMVNKQFGFLFQTLTEIHGIVPIGILRSEDEKLKNPLPFVYTNPPWSLLLMQNDLVYVLANPLTIK